MRAITWVKTPGNGLYSGALVSRLEMAVIRYGQKVVHVGFEPTSYLSLVETITAWTILRCDMPAP